MDWEFNLIRLPVAMMIRNSRDEAFLACDVSPPKIGLDESFKNLNELKTDIFSISYLSLIHISEPTSTERKS